MSAYRVVYITIPGRRAEDLAKRLINEKLAACINVIDSVKSLYPWKGEIKVEPESLLLVKTTTKQVENLIKFVRENHEYDIPEIISVEVSEGNPDYLNWLHEETITV